MSYFDDAFENKLYSNKFPPISMWESRPILYNTKATDKKIRIKYWPGAQHLEQWGKGGCIDLYNYSDLDLDKGEWGVIHLGVAMEIPEGYDALIFPRSSTFQNYGILQTNSVGYIDNSYNGPNDEWMVKVYATRACHIPAGTRCFQFRLIPQQPGISFIISDLLDNEDRNGFGSSGK